MGGDVSLESKIHEVCYLLKIRFFGRFDQINPADMVYLVTYIFDKLGYPAMVVLGELHGKPHAWNRINGLFVDAIYPEGEYSQIFTGREDPSGYQWKECLVMRSPFIDTEEMKIAIEWADSLVDWLPIAWTEYAPMDPKILRAFKKYQDVSAKVNEFRAKGVSFFIDHPPDRAIALEYWWNINFPSFPLDTQITTPKITAGATA